MQRRDRFHENYTTKQKDIQQRKKELEEFGGNFVEMYKGALIRTNPKERQIALRGVRDGYIPVIKSHDEISDNLEQELKGLTQDKEKEIQRRKEFNEELGIRAENLIEHNNVFNSIDRNIEESLKQRSISDQRWINEEIQEERDKASTQVKAIKKELRTKWSEIPVLSKFPVEQVRRLIIDGRYQLSDGRIKFTVDNEPSIIAGNLRLLNFTLDGLDIEGLEFDGHSPRKLDGQYFQEMHDIAIADTYRQVGEGKVKERFQIGYRGFLRNTRDIWFGWVDGNYPNYTQRGLEELQEKIRCRRGGEGIDRHYREAGHPVGNSCLDPFYNNGQTYKLKEATWRECLAIADAIIDRCYDEIEKSKTPDEKLTAIVRCGQDLEQAHVLPDGNIRTIAFGVILKLLLEQGERPPIWYDPNILDGYDVETLKAKILEGQETTRTYLNPIEA